jgi:acyl carrier protein
MDSLCPLSSTLFPIPMRDCPRWIRQFETESLDLIHRRFRRERRVAPAAKRASDFRADRSRNKDDGDLAGCPSSLGNRPTSNFFDLGGHSLMAMRLMIKVASTFGVKIRPESQFHWS